jgi:hypothetical protein
VASLKISLVEIVAKTKEQKRIGLHLPRDNEDKVRTLKGMFAIMSTMDVSQ